MKFSEVYNKGINLAKPGGVRGGYFIAFEWLPI
jgi:hypothetical protein